MIQDNQASYLEAVRDFHQARRRADIERIIARLTGKSADLLSYDHVRQQLHARESGPRVLKDIPLDAIVGSVGRYTDFSRSFLPLDDSDLSRWAQVRTAVSGLIGVPAIEVYKIGEVYFVRDGNHRVSVARQFGASHIEAFVVELLTSVPLTPDLQPDEIILKAEYASFLGQTGLDKIRPEADLTVTAPGKYDTLLEHIKVHRYFMGRDDPRQIAFQEAMVHWYDHFYQPVLETIRQRGMLRDFPGRTETDLYIWVVEHRAALQESLGWKIDTEAAAADLADRRSSRPGRVLMRLGQRILDAVTPDELEPGPPVGEWRQEAVAARQSGQLFVDILVSVDGSEEAWFALEQAIEIAHRDNSRVHGIHVVAHEEQQKGDKARTVQDEFRRRCEEFGVTGDLAIQVGKVTRRICQASRWVDLTAVHLKFPPGLGLAGRLGSGFRTLVQRCPRPVLVVPERAHPLNRALLAYDGSPKAQEGLFIAAYMAARWGTDLIVATVTENGQDGSDVLEQAREYLEKHGAPAQLIESQGPIADTILGLAQEQDIDLLIMGGYGMSPLVGVVLGSVVDQVLRKSKRPMLICR